MFLTIFRRELNIVDDVQRQWCCLGLGIAGFYNLMIFKN
jgi:hypothetical protein